MNDNLFGERLGAALRDSSPQTPAGLDLNSVKGRARSIRRRRTATGSAAAAVALLAASPFAASTLAGDGDDPLPPADSPSPTPTVTLDLPAETVLTKDAPVDDAIEGDWIPGLGELDPTLQVPAGTQQGLVRLGHRWLVVYRNDDGGRTLHSVEVGDDGKAEGKAETYRVSDGVAVSDGHDLAAFVTDSGELTLVGEDGRTRVVTTLSNSVVVDLVGDAGCLDGTDCEMVVDHGGDQAPELVSGDGTRTVIDPDAVAVHAANGDLVATMGRESRQGDPPCTTVRDRSTFEEVWSSCEVAVREFSPDGQFAEVVDVDTDGIGPGRYGLVEAMTGKPVTWISTEQDQGFVQDVAWTPAGGLEVLTFTFDDRTWRLHRLSTDGTVTQAIDPRQGADMEAPYRAVTRP